MIIKDWKKDLLTIPNFLSLFRLLLIPLYMTIYLNAQNMTDHLIAGGILTVSCLTDAFDGQIARRFNMISTVGKVLDPLADKATQFALILCLVQGAVGVLEQFLIGQTVLRRESQTDGTGKWNGRILTGIDILNGVNETQKAAFHQLPVGDVGDENQEFIAADAANHIGAAEEPRDFA